MRKKTGLLLFLLILCMLIPCGCKSKESEIQAALVTDQGTVEDGSFNEAAFSGMKQFCEEKGLKYSYFIPQGMSVESYEAEIENAIKKGAEIIVCPGYMLEEAVYNEANKNSRTSFVLIDGEPHNSDYTNSSVKENVMPILFSEDEAGFLAGYAAVRDGYKHLSFIGGMPEDPVIRYGYGFVQGADYAAIELGVKVDIIYTYANTFMEDERVNDFAVNAYENGTEIIFACGGAMGFSVMKAAEKTGGKVIGVDVDQSNESPSVVFSATKNVASAVYDALASYYNRTFEGGKAKLISASEGGVGLSFTNSHFNKFSEIEYNAIYTELKTKNIQPYNNTDIGTAQELNLVNTKVSYADPENLSEYFSLMQSEAEADADNGEIDDQ